MNSREEICRLFGVPPPLPPLPPLPPPLPKVAEKVRVEKLGRDALKVTAGEVSEILTRMEAFRLLGMLERTVGSL